MVRPAGVIRPPPAPCSTRKATSSARLPASLQRADATVKSAIEPSSTRAVRPVPEPFGRRDEQRHADLIADDRPGDGGADVWNWRPIVARATLTIV